MWEGALKVEDGASTGAWIRPRLEGEIGAVTFEVPKGFDAYARIFHPASDSDQNRIRWGEVADAVGTTAHREMQWHAILGLADPDELHGSYRATAGDKMGWAGQDPPIGAMDLETLDALCEILAANTADPSQCYFGLCTIENWLESFAEDELKPLLELPLDRDHIVLSGPLSAVDEIARDWMKGGSQATFTLIWGGGPSAEAPAPDPMWRTAPNLIWPADRTWFVASEVDFDSTLVGGSAGLIKAIVDSSKLEAWQVEPTDSLTADADEINRPAA